MVDIQVRNLTKFFVIGENLLDDLSFEIQEGERVAILGRNGCGKTTLFNILTGQMDYDSGEVYVNPNKRLGLISQIPKFPAGYTVEDVLRTAYAGLMKLKARNHFPPCRYTSLSPAEVSLPVHNRNKHDCLRFLPQAPAFH